MYAFTLIHFGNNKKYLELELYFLINLKKYTKHDIIYLYSLNDTPPSFINIIQNYCTYTIPYDDNNITYNVQFNSAYPHFNLLRICNFIFAYKLVQYKKICTIESDMIIVKNIDDIFNLKTPALLINGRASLKNNYFVLDNKNTIFEKEKLIINNYKLTKKDIDFNKLDTNGGIFVFKPSIKKFELYIKNLKIIIENNYTYPNETLFLHSNKKIYNVPYQFNVNAKEYDIKNNIKKYNIYNIKKYINLLHFKVTTYKHIDIIRDKYLEQIKTEKPILYYFLKKYKKKYYDKYNKLITKILSDLD
jgi:hypothetical protein